MRRLLQWGLGLGMVAAGVAAANFRRDPGLVAVDWQLFRPAPPSVAVDRPGRGPIARVVAAQGLVEPVQQARVAAKVAGKVVEVLVEEGSAVRAGDPLVRLDDAPFRTRVDSAKTRLDTAKTNLGIAEAHLRDIEKDPKAATTPANPPAPAPNPTPNYPAGFPVPPSVSPTPAAGPSKLEAARDSVEGWKRERKAAEVDDESARANLDRATVRAPIAGVVEDLAAAVGDDVAPAPTAAMVPSPAVALPAGGMMGMPGFGAGSIPAAPPDAMPRALCTIMDPDQLRVRAWVDEGDVGLIRAGQPARVFLPDEPAVPIIGRVVKVAPRGRPAGEVVAFAATISLGAAPGRARAGMRVNVEVEVARRDDPLGVPVQAVVRRRRRDLSASIATTARPDADSGYVTAVFVLDGSSVRLRPIETGLSDERRVEVVAGLSAEDRVVVGPFRALDALDDGTAVIAEGEPDQPINLTRGQPGDAKGPAR